VRKELGVRTSTVNSPCERVTPPVRITFPFTCIVLGKYNKTLAASEVSEEYTGNVITIGLAINYQITVYHSVEAKLSVVILRSIYRQRCVDKLFIPTANDNSLPRVVLLCAAVRFVQRRFYQCNYMFLRSHASGKPAHKPPPTACVSEQLAPWVIFDLLHKLPRQYLTLRLHCYPHFIVISINSSCKLISRRNLLLFQLE
jgi:hypothetical protein